MSDIDSLYLLAAPAVVLLLVAVRLFGKRIAVALLVAVALFLPIPNHRGAWAEAFGVALIALSLFSYTKRIQAKTL